MFQEMQAILINSKPQDTGPIRCERLLKHKQAHEVFNALNLETAIIWIMASCILYVVINTSKEPTLSVVKEEINSDCMWVGLNTPTTSGMVASDYAEQHRPCYEKARYRHCANVSAVV
jgi:hypothetical protein